jgi:hypothetical protein
MKDHTRNVFGALLVFAIATLISHHNGINYDGDSTVGFPTTFYTKGYGKSLDTGQMQAFSIFSIINLLIDLICAFLCFAFVHFLFRRIFWKQS